MRIVGNKIEQQRKMIRKFYLKLCKNAILVKVTCRIHIHAEIVFTVRVNYLYKTYINLIMVKTKVSLTVLHVSNSTVFTVPGITRPFFTETRKVTYAWKLISPNFRSYSTVL